MQGSLLWGWVRPGMVGLALLVLALAQGPAAQATHLRAGDIQAKSDTTAARNPLRFFFKMITYSDVSSPASADATETIFFGDGTSTGVDAVTRASQTVIAPGIYRNVYFFEHTYNAPGRFTVAYIGENRQTGIRNMQASDQQTFYIHTVITIDPVLGINRSPVLTAPAVDKAGRRQVFLHNPGAFDPDGDSLAYKLRICQQVPGGVAFTVNNTGNQPRPQPVPGYRFPADPVVSPLANGGQVAYAGPPAGVPNAPNIFELNEITGQMVWNAPNTQGEYNVAFIVEEWRRTPGARARLIGEVWRDMQISVISTNNQRPTVFVPRDTCVVAGTTITRTITGTDPDNNLVRLQAFGGIFPPATFSQTRNSPGYAAATFRWTTSCSDVASEPTQVLFKAEDQPQVPNPTLIDERVWRIKVVGPPPQNLQATAQGSSVRLTWDRYFCTNASRIFIYRKENPSAWRPDACETGIPSTAGYVQVGEVGANLTEFRDDNSGRGLERGKNYCYRIYAEFPRPAGGASIASQEVCVLLSGRPVLFTNVTVDRTDVAQGQITVRWTKPVSTSGFNPPVGYRLFRAEGTNPGIGYTLIRTINALSDTVHVDGNLDTETKAYTYRLEFFSNISPQSGSASITENAGPASSVRLNGTAEPTTNSIALSWTYAVPWDNSRQPTRIFRRDPGSTQFVLVGTATGTASGGSFTDRGTTAQPLRKNQAYCYYVETNGAYTSPSQPSGLVNLSQVRCVTLSSIPCTPILSLRPINCDSVAAQLPRGGIATYTNYLTWTLGNTPAECGRNITSYRVLYRPTTEGDFTEIARTTVPRYEHRNLRSAAGCYAVIAVDSLGNSSAQSNIECQDNCLIFVLPNIFTPNGDGKNDTFRPIFASPVARAKVKVFNRWGVQVYDGLASPDLTLWDGGGARGGEGRDSGAKVTAGTYYYLVEVEFADLKQTQKTYKGWIEVMR